MSTKVAWVLRFRSAMIASTRIRCLNVMDELSKLGVTCDFYDEAQSTSYKAVIFVKAYSEPELALARKLRKRGTKVIFDLCDNHFLQKNDSETEKHRVDLLRSMIGAADVIVASTEELRLVIRQECPEFWGDIVVIGDAVENQLPASPLLQRPMEWLQALHLRLRLAKQESMGRRRLVWFGIHGGDNAEYGMNDLKTVASSLNNVNRKEPITLTIISNNREKAREVAKSFDFPVFYMPWGSSTFLTMLKHHEMVIIPVTVNPFTRCKSNNRLALSLEQGLPVVATSMPAYKEFASCVRLDNWEEGVLDYLRNPEKVAHDVLAGQAIIHEKYSATSIGRQWLELLGGLSKA